MSTTGHSRIGEPTYFTALGPCEECGAAFQQEPYLEEEWGDDEGEGEEIGFLCSGPDEHPRDAERLVWRYEHDHSG